MLWQWANNRKMVFILDLDGTLIPVAEIDNQCFWQAVFECFEKQGPLPDLHGFKYVTDSGILPEWCKRELGRVANAEETLQIRDRFLELLEQAVLEQPQSFSPLNGVKGWLQAVQENPNVFAAIATGGWEHSARFKLQVSGLDSFAMPLASSDDAIPRTEIMQLAVTKLPDLQVTHETDFIYVGDGVWDLQASQALGWKFIGIASGMQAMRLRKAGASTVRTDFAKA